MVSIGRPDEKFVCKPCRKGVVKGESEAGVKPCRRKQIMHRYKKRRKGHKTGSPLSLTGAIDESPEKTPRVTPLELMKRAFIVIPADG